MNMWPIGESTYNNPKTKSFLSKIESVCREYNISITYCDECLVFSFNPPTSAFEEDITSMHASSVVEDYT